MAILKSRDELLPVTCGILKDEVREKFFTTLKKKTGGKMERLARTAGVTVAVVTGWAKGGIHIPYHSLQQLAVEFKLEIPEISELRREYQQVAEAPKSKRATTGRITTATPKPPKIQREKKSPAKDAPAKKPSPSRRAGRRERKKNARTDKPPASQEGKTKSPDKLTDERAYWTGVLLARARRDETMIRLDADRRVSQNFAATWSNLTASAFDVKPELSMSEDRSVQTAVFPAESVGAFLARLEFPVGAEPASAPAAPRWVWSNAAWKIAFLKGMVDATARFHRTPALKFVAPSKRLAGSAKKILATLDIPVKIGDDNSISIEGEDAVRMYFEKVGTENPKLRDQAGAYLKSGRPPTECGGGTSSHRGSVGRSAAPAPESASGPRRRSTRGRRRSRRGRSKGV